MVRMLQFLLIVLLGLAVTVTAEIQDCQRINLTIFCLNDTICANCSTEAFYNCSFANCPYNVSIQWNIHPSHRDVGSTLENETLEGPPEILISNFSTFDFENGNLGCFANSSAYRVLSESIPLQGLCQDRHRYHQASAKHNSLKYTVDIPRTYDIEGGVHLRVFPRDPSLPKLKESLSGARVTKFGSDILEVKVQTKQGEPLTDFPDEPVLLTFPVDPYDPSKEKPLCCFREELGYWSTHGCNTNIKSSDTVQCSCNHLTSFAILMQTSEVDVDDRILTILTKIGLSISITCLILTLLIYALCRLKSLRIIIHANLAFALLVGHTVFLFIDTENKAGCAVVAVLLHFFFLAAFTWMALEGVFLLIKSTPTFPWRIRLPAWFAVGWGVPASVVLMSIASKFVGNPICIQIPWEKNEEALQRWRDGQTGFPWIDAIMIQLRQEGWVHPVARHAVACFLTRGDLWISWEEGAKIFEDLLLDADWSVNAGNWIWLSCSSFYQQFFHCYTFCPVKFGQQTDPNGDFIRKYIPALKNFSSKYIYNPWTAPLEIQEQAKCTIGKDYPFPMVNHNEAIRRNTERMNNILQNVSSKTPKYIHDECSTGVPSFCRTSSSTWVSNTPQEPLRKMPHLSQDSMPVLSHDRMLSQGSMALLPQDEVPGTSGYMSTNQSTMLTLTDPYTCNMTQESLVAAQPSQDAPGTSWNDSNNLANQYFNQ